MIDIANNNGVKVRGGINLCLNKFNDQYQAGSA